VALASENSWGERKSKKKKTAVKEVSSAPVPLKSCPHPAKLPEKEKKSRMMKLRN